MNRREFASLVASGAVATALVSPLTAEVQTEVIEFHSTKQYIIKFKELLPVDKCSEIEAWLRAKGLNCIVLCGDVELLEIK